MSGRRQIHAEPDAPPGMGAGRSCADTDADADAAKPSSCTLLRGTLPHRRAPQHPPPPPSHGAMGPSTCSYACCFANGPVVPLAASEDLAEPWLFSLCVDEEVRMQTKDLAETKPASASARVAVPAVRPSRSAVVLGLQARALGQERFQASATAAPTASATRQSTRHARC